MYSLKLSSSFNPDGCSPMEQNTLKYEALLVHTHTQQYVHVPCEDQLL